MDSVDIYDLVGETIYQRGRDCVGHIKTVTSGRNEEGVRHLTAAISGSSRARYRTEVWLRPDGSFISGSCTCPYNTNGEGPECKHIAALLLWDLELGPDTLPSPPADPAAIPGVVRGAGSVSASKKRKSSYTSDLDSLFGKKWREDKPKSDPVALHLLKRYQEGALAGVEALPEQRKAFVTLQTELTMPYYTVTPPLVRLRIGEVGAGRKYIVRSVLDLLTAIEEERSVSYGKQLAFVHRWDAFTPEAQQLLQLMRRLIDLRRSSPTLVHLFSDVPAGTEMLTGELFDDLVDLYAPTGAVGGYTLHIGLPPLHLRAKKKRGGAQLSLSQEFDLYRSLNRAYFFSMDENELSLWQTSLEDADRVEPALNALGGNSIFFTREDAADFCSYVLPELSDGADLTIDDPDRLLLNQIPLKPVVQFYLDAPNRSAVTARAEFLYGEERVQPFAPAPANLIRDGRTERRAQHLLSLYLHPDPQTCFREEDEDTIFRFLEEGVPALLAEGEVYLSDEFRNLQAAPPKISVGVSVHGSVLDLEVDTGEFPIKELRDLLKSLHQKKRYHRLRDGRLLRLDDSLETLDELNETLELSGAKLGQAHAQLPLYRAPSLDRALSGQNGVRFDRDDAFRRISRSFHAVKDSEYTPPASLQKVLRKYQRDGYRWLRTLDGYGMGGILADDMGLGKTLQVLSYLLAIRQESSPDAQHEPSLIVCPASLVLNWAEECRKFTPELTCVAVDGDAAHRAALASQWAQADLVVTSYDLLRRDEALYADQRFYACILDEAQAIKNHTTQKYKAVCQINSRVRFALTGTPVENRLGELWSIFSFLMPGYLPPYKSFCARFEKPIVQEDDANAAKRLNQLTGPFILRRMKSEVLKELPTKTETLYRVEMAADQRKLYLAAVVDAREKLRAARPEDKMAVFAVLMRLREICCDPRLIADNWDGSSAKLDACMDLVSSAVEGGHRILLFSQFTSMLELLAKRLDKEGITHFTLQGSTPKPQRAELVRRFNAGEADVFLISLRAGGTGLNLTAADIVIHYDPWWNLAAQNQATDRAYRIGQQNPVQVYKLIAQDTIEEKIVELQQAKQSLADTVTGTADGAILSMSPDDLLGLLDSREEAAFES